MSKLDPKPTTQNPLLGWDDLNRRLQASFMIANKKEAPSLTIDVSEFEMSKEEIIAEVQSQGYKVSDSGNDYLVFK